MNAGLCLPSWARFTAALGCSVLALPAAATVGDTPAADARVREVIYNPQAVVSVPVKRGVVALVVLDSQEAITDLAAGLGGDCNRAESAWCVNAQPGARHFFVKAKSQASAANHVVVVTERHHHSFRFVVLADEDPRQPVYKLVVKMPSATAVAVAQPGGNVSAHPASTGAAPAGPNPLLPLLLSLATATTPTASPTAPARPLLSDRLQHKPQVLNTQYSLAEGEAAQDIVPTLVFDDGRFTYFRFSGRRELPAVFHVLADGSETLVNTRMEDELLVVDRVSRRLMLRAGSAAVGIWNDAYDLDDDPAAPAAGAGTTVPGVKRVLKAGSATHPETGVTSERSPR